MQQQQQQLQHIMQQQQQQQHMQQPQQQQEQQQRSSSSKRMNVIDNTTASGVGMPYGILLQHRGLAGKEQHQLTNVPKFMAPEFTHYTLPGGTPIYNLPPVIRKSHKKNTRMCC
eukprot:GHVQ01035119.1.p1 GENE.GHVQ01035119.1~~GHVQ01035119.1.p1  ORF type:complete len:114 (-),score=42.13 GHVQ01035119.1:189-530(-)